MYHHLSPTTKVQSHVLPQEEARVQAAGSGSQNMDRLVDLLNSMRSNSSGVEQQLASFMEEAQCSARSEETLAQVVSTIYSKAVSDRSFAATAAKLCEKMALFMVEGTKFRSLLLNMLQVRLLAAGFPHLLFSYFLSAFRYLRLHNSLNNFRYMLCISLLT